MSRLDTLIPMLAQEGPRSCTLPSDDEINDGPINIPQIIPVIDEYCTRALGDCKSANCPIWFVPDVLDKLEERNE